MKSNFVYLMKVNRGFSIIEIIVACAIFLGTMAAFITASDILRDLDSRVEDKTHASLLIEEGAEAILLLRDLDWANNLAVVTLDSTYWLYWDGDSYELSEVAVAVAGKYWRQVTFRAVERDGAGTLVESGTTDTDTLKVEIEIKRIADNESLAFASMLVHNSHE